MLSCPVTSVDSNDDGHLLGVAKGTLSVRWVVNAAGLYSDKVDRMFGFDGFNVTPRRGQLIVFDKFARSLLNSMLLPVPTAITKGTFIAPSVFGNVLVGATAEDLEDRTATQTTAEGITQLLDQARRILPRLVDEEVTTVYAGLRAATEYSDYQIQCHPDERYVCVGGIRSTGLSACMGIAAYVVELMADAGLKLSPAPRHRSIRMPQLAEHSIRPYQDEDAIARNPACGEIICHCERVSRARSWRRCPRRCRRARSTGYAAGHGRSSAGAKASTARPASCRFSPKRWAFLPASSPDSAQGNVREIQRRRRARHRLGPGRAGGGGGATSCRRPSSGHPRAGPAETSSSP